MVRLVATGRGETIALPSVMQYVISLTGKIETQVKVLYLGTLSEDDEDIWKETALPYQVAGCLVTKINLWNSSEELKSSIIKEVEEQLCDSDILLLSGGRSLPGIRKWKELGIDQLLLDAARQRHDLVLAGGSAGALCW